MEFTLNEQQQRAVKHFEGPMIILSVAGSGKTHVLTERLVNLIEQHSIPASNILAITFAKKASIEMLDRLDKKLNGQSRKLTVCTFHSLGYRILKEAGHSVELIQNHKQVELFQKAATKAGVVDDTTELMAQVSMAKNSLVPPEELAMSSDKDKQALAKVYQGYELLKRRKGFVDYDDLLCLPYQLLCEDESLLKYYQKRFKFLMIDEFQDSNVVMIELVKLLSNEHQNIWACGDDDQIIHEFRGAHADVFVSFEQHFQGNIQTITMSENFRSSWLILEAANKLISHNKTRIKKEMKTSNGDGEPVRILEAQDEVSEAALIADEIFKLREKGIRYEDMSVLFRVHRLIPHIEAALIKEGTPYTLRNQSLLNRIEIRTALSVMKFLITRETTRGLNTERLHCLTAELFPGRTEFSLNDAFDLGRSYVMRSALTSLEENSLTKIYLSAFGEIVSDHQDFYMLEKGIDYLTQKKETSKGVHLMTIHQAKGLEFEASIIPSVNENILPHFNSMNNIEEERRLMYVAMTRAKKHLIITYLKTKDGQAIPPSRFIKEMGLIS